MAIGIMLILAILSFLLAALGVPSLGPVALLPLGLALLAGALLFGGPGIAFIRHPAP